MTALEGSAPKLVVVLGMHRSGTSAITRALKVLGVSLGDRLMPPAAGDNEKGFWEDLEVNAINNELLSSLGRDWDSLSPLALQDQRRHWIPEFEYRAMALLRGKMQETGCFGIKDPRIPRLLPFWRSVFERLRIQVAYVIAVRNPLSVACSLERRNGMGREKGFYLWLEHVVPAILETQNSPRVVVDFDRLIERPEPEVRRIAAGLGLEERLDAVELREFASEFLEQDLRHTRFSRTDLEHEPAVPPMAGKIFEVLYRAARDELALESAEAEDVLQRAADELGRHAPAFRYMDHQDRLLVDRDARIADSDTQISELERKLAERNSQIEVLGNQVAQRDRRIADLITERDRRIADLITDRDRRITDLTDAAAKLQGRIAVLEQAVAEREQKLALIFSSRSWRLTAPLRFLSRAKDAIVQSTHEA